MSRFGWNPGIGNLHTVLKALSLEITDTRVCKFYQYSFDNTAQAVTIKVINLSACKASLPLKSEQWLNKRLMRIWVRMQPGAGLY